MSGKTSGHQNLVSIFNVVIILGCLLFNVFSGCLFFNSQYYKFFLESFAMDELLAMCRIDVFAALLFVLTLYEFLFLEARPASPPEPKEPEVEPLPEPEPKPEKEPKTRNTKKRT